MSLNMDKTNIIKTTDTLVDSKTHPRVAYTNIRDSDTDVVTE